MKTYPQGSLLWPVEPIQFKADNGRDVKLDPSQSVWVVNTQVNQSQTGTVKIARSGRNAGYAWRIAIQDAEKFFTNGEKIDKGAAIENYMATHYQNVI